MDIRLLNMDSNARQVLQSEKVISVRVLERNGNTVTIDLNGIKTTATLEAEVGNSFLALVEKDENNTVRLRVFGALKNSDAYREHSREKLSEALKFFLQSNNIPLSESYLGLALKMHAFGLKQDAQILKLLHLALLKYGEGFTNTLLGFIREGFRIDGEFLPFFQSLKSLYRKLLERQKILIESKEDFIKLDTRVQDETAQMLDNLMQKTAQNNKTFFSALAEYENEEILFLIRREDGDKRERYYFDIDSETLGQNLLIIDRFREGFEIKVYLNPRLYIKIKPNLTETVERLTQKISDRLQNQRLILSIAEYSEEHLFWKSHNYDEDSQSHWTFNNLDIYI